MKGLWVGIELSFAIALGGVALVLGGVLPAARPVFGRRGERRVRALADSALLRLSEPLLLQVAAWVGRVCPPTWRRALGARLARAGHWLGLTEDEFVALGLLGAVVGGVVAVFSSVVLEIVSVRAALFGPALLGAVPLLRLASEEQRRRIDMNRALPTTIDLVALCMSAGVDFAGAVRFVVGEPGARDLAREELAVVLRELEFGRTRAEALAELAERVPCDAVQSFVGAIVQAEEKGNPLAEVLQIQATVLRGQRSVAAEVAAARAGVLMVAPLLLLLACILVLLLGPFILGGGF